MKFNNKYLYIAPLIIATTAAFADWKTNETEDAHC